MSSVDYEAKSLGASLIKEKNQMNTEKNWFKQAGGKIIQNASKQNDYYSGFCTLTKFTSCEFVLAKNIEFVFCYLPHLDMKDLHIYIVEVSEVKWLSS